jgi:hypothetical protein
MRKAGRRRRLTRSRGCVKAGLANSPCLIGESRQPDRFVATFARSSERPTRSQCDLPHAHLSWAAVKSARVRSQTSVAMAGLHRLSREWDRKPSAPSHRRAPKLDFDLILMILLATLAITVTLMFPEIQLAPSEFAGP